MKAHSKFLPVLFLMMTMILCSCGSNGGSAAGDRIPYSTDPAYDFSNLRKEKGVRIYEDDNYYSELLIDVSKYQKSIDWDAIADKGIVKGTIIRLGYRHTNSDEINPDPFFEDNLKGAGKAGIPVHGIYFFSQALNAKEAKEEADFVLKKLKKQKVSKDVMVYLDLEAEPHYRNANLTDDEIMTVVDSFAERIEEEGYTVGVYSNGNLGNRQIGIEMFESYPVWFARYNDKPGIDSGYQIWQYSKEGTITGITGHVDLNLHFIKKE